jgi:hypothetical protein
MFSIISDRRASHQNETSSVRLQRSTPDLLGSLHSLGHVHVHGEIISHKTPTHIINFMFRKQNYNMHQHFYQLKGTLNMIMHHYSQLCQNNILFVVRSLPTFAIS